MRVSFDFLRTNTSCRTSVFGSTPTSNRRPGRCIYRGVRVAGSAGLSVGVTGKNNFTVHLLRSSNSNVTGIGRRGPLAICMRGRSSALRMGAGGVVRTIGVGGVSKRILFTGGFGSNSCSRRVSLSNFGEKMCMISIGARTALTSAAFVCW